MTKFTTIEFIVFLSKILTLTEKRYWSIELEIAAMMWIVKKLHHMIKASKHSTIIWTDHSIIVSIIKQTKMSISNTNKLNLRLVRIDMYLSQFDLNVRHKSDRDHIISNALSRLSFFNNSTEEITNTLKNVKVYVETLIEMSFTFKTRLIEIYKSDREWSSLYVMLKNLHISAQITRRNVINADTFTSEVKNTIIIIFESFTHDEIEFERIKDLIYHLNRITSKTRLCILRSLIKEIFHMTHDEQAHVEFHRAYVIITKTFYIRRLTHYLRQYIDYCSQCLLNQTKRHKSYEALISISFSKISFHIITMNFVLTLSQSKQKKFDIMLTVIDKFFKSKLLISETNTWKAKNWAQELLRYLQLCNWDILRIIISDRDAKFRFEMWKWMFKILQIDLLINTTYHLQTDDQSKRINQIIEIALRYFLTTTSNSSWHKTLSSLQQRFMNTKTFTEQSSNEILYEMNTRSHLSLLKEDETVINNELIRDIIRKDVADVIDFVNAHSKIIFDRKHQSLVFNSDDKIYLRLHHEYFLSKKNNFKLFNQRSDSYTIKRKIENAVYELNLSQNSRIHSVIFIAQLKSTLDSDSFNRFKSINSDSIETEDDTLRKKSYEIERILKKRSRKYDRITIIEYLMQWKNWESKHNSWVSRKDCENVADLILKFENRTKNAWRASIFFYLLFFS
jgi:hypothetical protein